MKLLFILLTVLGFATAIIKSRFEPPPNEMSMVEVEQLAKKVRPGMSVSEISDVFGFDFDKYSEVNRPQWTFRVPELRHGFVVYSGKFSNDRLVEGDLWSAL